MEIEEKQNSNGELVVAVSGRVDGKTAPEFEAFLQKRLGGVSRLVIDLSDAVYVSSAGLRVLMFAYKELTRAQGAVVLRHPNEYVADTLDATGFNDLMEIER